MQIDLQLFLCKVQYISSVGTAYMAMDNNEIRRKYTKISHIP